MEGQESSVRLTLNFALLGTSPVVEWLRFYLPVQGVWVQDPVHMPCGQKNQNIKCKQYCNKFNKTFFKKWSKSTKDREDWRPAVHGVTKSWTQLR